MREVLVNIKLVYSKCSMHGLTIVILVLIMTIKIIKNF